MKKHTVILLVVLLAFLGSCNPKNGNNNVIKEEKQLIEIGSIIPLTGPAAEYGNYIKSGQTKAMDYLNEIQDSVEFKIHFQDGQADVSKSITEYELLKSRDIKIYTTTISSVCVALSERARNDEVLIFADASHPKITDPASKFVFRHFGTIKQEADLMTEKVGNSKVACLYANNDFGKAFESYFNDSSVIENNIVFQEVYDHKASNFSALALKVKNQSPEVLILAGYGTSAVNIITELKKLKVEIPMYTPLAFVITNSHQKLTKDFDNVNCVTLENQESLTSSDISAYEAVEYGTIDLIGMSYLKSGADSLDINKFTEYLSNLENYESKYETMNFSKDGSILPDLEIVNIQKLLK